MAELGGYAAVTYVSRDFVPLALEQTWDLHWADARGPVSYSVSVAGGTLTATGAIGLDKPSVELVSNSNRARVGLSAGLRLSASVAGAPVTQVFLRVAASVTVPIVVTPGQSLTKGTLDLSGFTIDASEMDVLAVSGTLGPAIANALKSPEVRARVAGDLERRAAKSLVFPLPTDELWLANMAAITTTTPTGLPLAVPLIQIGAIHILDDWVALGIDASGETAGDPAAIGPPPDARPGGQGTQFALVIDGPLLEKYLQTNADFTQDLKLAGHPEVHPEGYGTVSLEDGYVEVKSSGTVDAPDPLPGTFPYQATLRFSFKVNRSVSVRLDTVVSLAEPWFVTMVRSIVDVYDDVFDRVRKPTPTTEATVFDLELQFDVPDMPGMRLKIFGDRVVVAPDHAAVWASLRLETSPSPGRAPAVLGGRVGSDGNRIRERFMSLNYEGPGSGLIALDATYLMRFTLARGSDGTTVFDELVWSGPGGGRSEAVDLWRDDLYLETEFRASLMIERPPGNVVLQAADTVRVRDMFDRAHPYVRFWHEHQWYEFVGGHDGYSKRSVARSSAIHKTAIRERCKFCDQSQYHADYAIQPLDALPAPEQPPFRSELCPYCFG